MVEKDRFVFRGMDRKALGENGEMLPPDINNGRITLSAALTQREGSILNHSYIFTSSSVNVAKWYAENEERNGRGPRNSVFIIDTDGIEEKSLFSYRNARVETKKNAVKR